MRLMQQDTYTGGSNPVKGFLSYFYGNFIVLILGFIQTPLITRILPTDEYGRTGMFETAVSIIYIFAILGLDQSYMRYYYVKDIDRVALIKKCLAPALIIVTGLSGLYVFFSDAVNGFLFERSGSGVVILVVAYTYICVFERFIFLDVRMDQNGKLYSNINIIEKVLSIVTLIGAYFIIGDDFRIGLLALVVPWGCTTLFLAVRYLIKHRDYRRSPDSYVPTYRELISYGLPLITVLLMEWALSSADKLALRTFSDFNELGIYNSAMKIIVLLLTFKNTFIAYWSPVAMERFEKAEMEENKDFFGRVYEAVVFLCILLSVFMILFRKVIVLLLGPDYRMAEAVLPFLTLMPVFAMMFEVTNQSIKYTKKGIYLNIASIAAIIVNVSGNIALVPRLGGLGAAITTGVSYMAYFAIGSYFAEKCIRIGYNYRKTAIYALLLTAFCLEASFVNSVPADTLSGLMILCIAVIMDRKVIVRLVSYAKNIFKK